MNVAITGGRDYFPSRGEGELFLLWLSHFEHDTENGYDPSEDLITDRSIVFHGAASGVDSFIAGVATVAGYEVKPFFAAWRPPGVYDPQAGHKRNAKMLEEADVLIAFPGGNGTDNCILQAKEKGIRVIMIEEVKDASNDNSALPG